MLWQRATLLGEGVPVERIGVPVERILAIPVEKIHSDCNAPWKKSRGFQSGKNPIQLQCPEKSAASVISLVKTLY